MPDLYDPKCAELARYFLEDTHFADDSPCLTEENVASLAVDIQEAVDHWFSAQHQKMRGRLYPKKAQEPA